jgi:hypothetical protein
MEVNHQRVSVHQITAMKSMACPEFTKTKKQNMGGPEEYIECTTMICYPQCTGK